MTKLELYEDYSREAAHDIFAPETPFTPQSGTWGIQGIIQPPDRPNDFVLFVTFGKKEGSHEFDEGISSAGILRWQSQPRQKLQDKIIQRLIAHDESKHSVYLFLRTADKRKGQTQEYTYLGRLKYVLHNNTTEQPVYFDWQLLDWPVPSQTVHRIQLQLEGAAPMSALAPETALPELKDGDWFAQEAAPPTQGSRSGASPNQFKVRAKPDYSAQEKANRTLGMAGEKLVVKFEQDALISAGLPALAAKVRHVAAEEGDGAGYDILSFFPDGRHRYIEVKTTRGAISSDFYLSPNEIEFARIHPENFELRRLYAYNAQNFTYCYYSVFGDLEKQFKLTPTEYKVSRLKS